MTDTNDYLATYELHRKAEAQANKLNKPIVFDALKAAGITTVTVTFDGEGDSGQIEEMTADDAREIPDTQLDIHQAAWNTLKLNRHAVSLRDAIELLCYDLLSQDHGGWENNEGAFGEFTFHVPNCRITLEINERFSDFDTSSHTF